MTTEWVVTVVGGELKLNAARHGEMTFAVHNPGPAADTAYFFAVVDSEDPAVRGRQPWLKVEVPQLPVAADTTVSYTLTADVPATFPAGKYFLKGIAYSAGTAAEENPRESARVAFDVAPGKQPWPWLPWIVALVLVLVVGGVAAWFFTRPGKTPEPGPSVSPSVSVPASPKPPIQPIIREAESLISTATVTGVGKDQLFSQASCCGVNWSGNRQAWLKSADGSSVTFRITIAEEWDYRLSMTRTTSWDYANTVTEVDGKILGNLFNGYTPDVRITNVTDGTVRLTPGEHTITIRALGKHASSTGYYLGVDQIRLEPVRTIIIGPLVPLFPIVVSP